MVCRQLSGGGDPQALEGSYEVRRRGGRSLIQHPPQFSPDQSLIFVICGQNIQIYDVLTAEFVRSLRSEEKCSPIVGMGFPQNDDRSLITCDKLGKIITWKWHASVQTHEMNLQIADCFEVQTFHLISNNEAFVSWRGTEFIHVGVFNLENGCILRSPPVSQFKPHHRWCVAIGTFDEGPIVAFSNGASTVHIFDINNPKKYIRHKTPSDLEITTLSWHPSLNLLAVGDSLGRAILWCNPLDTKRPPKETCHWHHLPLTTVTFSPRGGLMLTGGAERVVVVWGTNNSKRFLPRLPASILHLSASNTHIAISTSDNGIQIVDTGTLKVTGCIREAGGLGGAKKQCGVKGPSLQYVRNAAGLLLPAGSGHLHLYSTTSHTLLYTMDVTNTNIVHPERDNLNPEQTEINEISVGCQSQWLVTWEGRNEQERIRWWEWTGHDFKLHTVATCPHQPALPSSLCLAEDSPVTITTDNKNNVQFWRIIDSLTEYENKSVWLPSRKKSGGSGEAGGIALSGDGSVAAVWIDARLTLWDTFAGVQKACLAHPALRPQGRLVQFGRDNHMHYVACSTDNCLAVWNTMTLKVIWIVKLNVSCLTSDPFSNRIAAVTKENDVFIFKMNEPEPLLKLENTLPFEQGLITSAAFAPSDSGPADFKLFFLREQQEIFVIEKSELPAENEPALERISNAVRSAPSAYSAMIADKKASTVTSYQSSYRPQLSSKAVITDLLLSSATHTQPKLSSICGTVLRALASTQISSNVNTNDVSEDKLDENVDENINENAAIKRPSKKKLMKEPMEWVSILLSNEGND